MVASNIGIGLIAFGTRQSAERKLRLKFAAPGPIEDSEVYSAFREYAVELFEDLAQAALDQSESRQKFGNTIARGAIKIIREILPGRSLELTRAAYREACKTRTVPMEMEDPDELGQSVYIEEPPALSKGPESIESWLGINVKRVRFDEYDRMMEAHSLWEDVLMQSHTRLAFDDRQPSGRRRIRTAMKIALRPRITYWIARAEGILPASSGGESIGSVHASMQSPVSLALTKEQRLGILMPMWNRVKIRGQNHWADLAGLGQSTVSEYLAGIKVPSPGAKVKLAKPLKVKPGELPF